MTVTLTNIGISQPLKLRQSDQIVARMMDQDLVVIDFESGNYYSLAGAAVDIWNDLERAPLSAVQLADRLERRYVTEPGVIANDTDVILTNLLEAKLITLAETEAEQVDTAPTGERMEYPGMSVTRFDDLADAFALDPPLVVLPESDHV